MSVRYYCPQWHHFAKGWMDLPMLASLKQKEANDAAEQFAKMNRCVARIIRKPKGWKPNEKGE